MPCSVAYNPEIDLKKNRISRTPPSGAPEGTVWFGGPVDRFKITLRIFGEQLDPDHISVLLGCLPTTAERAGILISSEEGARIPRRSRWSLTVESRDLGQDDDVEDGIKVLLGRLPSDPATWTSITTQYKADLFCGVFLASSNRGFVLSSELSRLLADRNLDIGFDIYLDLPV